MRNITIAVDGHSSCGKSTMAKALAKRLGYRFIDSGAMYRAVTLYSLQHNLIDELTGELLEEELKSQLDSIKIRFSYNPELGFSETYLNGVNVEKDIRTLYVSNFVSKVAAVPFVRRAMVAQQQEMGREKSIVMDGRDIGSVVFPDAELKVFVTASPKVRAERRMKELQAKGENAKLEEVLENLMMRDKIDQERADSPLIRAEDAYLLDNSEMSFDQQNEWIYKLAQEKINA